MRGTITIQGLRTLLADYRDNLTEKERTAEQERLALHRKISELREERRAVQYMLDMSDDTFAVAMERQGWRQRLTA